jgi:peptidoglycan L-alanyl-D-glutamate endopeptidase CwlK
MGRLQLVHPELKRRIMKMAEILDGESIPIQVTQGLRTWAEEDALYAQGRTSPGKIVTDARGGQSAHNFGYAVDLVPEEIEPGQPDWNETHPAWKRMLEVGRVVGLAEGANWRSFKDAPHFYLQEFPADPTDMMRQDFKDAGMLAVWQTFDVSIDT